MKSTILFPIKLDNDLKSIPWEAIAPHEAQAYANHHQSLTQLANRGGLTPEEAVAIMEGRPWERMSFTAARERLKALVMAHLQAKNAPPELCDDEGCEHHGTPHVCVNGEQLEDRLARSVATVQMMRRRQRAGSPDHINLAEIERALSAAKGYIHAYRNLRKKA